MIKSCEYKTFIVTNGSLTTFNFDFDVMLELEGYLDYVEKDSPKDFTFVEFSILTSDEHLGLVRDSSLLSSLKSSRIVFLQAVLTASNVENFFTVEKELMIPAEWPDREYILLHQCHNDNFLKLKLPKNIKPVFYDFHLNVFKSYYQYFPYKTKNSWIRQSSYNKSWLLDDIEPEENRSKIFLSPVFYGYHSSREKIRELISNNPQWSGHYSLIDRRINRDLQFNLNNNKNVLYGMLNDPLIVHDRKFVPWENTVIGPQNPDCAIFRELELNLVHGMYYKDTFISVFGESVEEGPACIITEKTLHPIAQGHFILPIGCPGIIKALKKIGFLFPDFINYAYDSVDNNEERIEMFGEEFKRLMSFDIQEWREHYRKNINIIHYNRQMFYKPYQILDI